MTTWYWIDEDKNEHGPIAPDKLLMLIRQGEIFRETLVRKDSSAWCRSDHINGLWDSAAKPYKFYICVECGYQIDRPPSRCSKCERLVEKANEKWVTPNLKRMKSKTELPATAAGKGAVPARPEAKVNAAKSASAKTEKVKTVALETGETSRQPTERSGAIRSVWKKAISLRDRLLPKSQTKKK